MLLVLRGVARNLLGEDQVRYLRSRRPLSAKYPWRPGTVVDPEHRRRGLARWLKAGMLDLVLLERKQVDRVRTENADVNEAMLKINDALGYRHFRTQTEWQLGLEWVKEYLSAG